MMASSPPAVRTARRQLLALLSWLAFPGLAAGSPGSVVRVAAATNFSEPGRAIGAAFEKETGDRVLFSFGSTGQLYAQISQGAPFEVFLAADSERPARAEREGLAVAGSRRTYAVGRLVLLSRDPERVRGPDTLRDPSLRRIALANPRTAPYGRAALEVMESLDLAEALRPRRVVGANVSQAQQFILTGNAELGFVALSQTIGRDGGSRWQVPAALHRPIVQQAVLLEAGRESRAAARFLDFLLESETARRVLARFGYEGR